MRSRTAPTVEELLAQSDWHDERKALRALLLDCGLIEAVKWNKLCYMAGDRNVAMIYGLKDACALGFLKGALLADPEGILEAPGENSRSNRWAKFTSVAGIEAAKATLAGYVAEAVRNEEAGVGIDFAQDRDLDWPDELVDRFDQEPELRDAFEALTPGRQRGYILHFADAKQAATRAARIDRHAPRIRTGKGMHDR